MGGGTTPSTTRRSTCPSSSTRRRRRLSSPTPPLAQGRGGKYPPPRTVPLETDHPGRANGSTTKGEQTMDTNTQDQATQGQATDSAVDQATPAKMYATRTEAEANKPADAPKSLKPF